MGRYGGGQKASSDVTNSSCTLEPAGKADLTVTSRGHASRDDDSAGHDPAVDPALQIGGVATGSGPGCFGKSTTNVAVYGESSASNGVAGKGAGFGGLRELHREVAAA